MTDGKVGERGVYEMAAGVYEMGRRLAFDTRGAGWCGLAFAPEDVAGVGGHAVRLAAEGVALPLGIGAPAVGEAAYQVDGVGDAEVLEGLGEVVERLVREGLDDHDFAVAVAQRAAYRFVFGFVVDQFAVVDERILAEEVAAGLGSPLEERGVFGHAYGDGVVYDGTVADFGFAPGQGFALEHEGAHDFTVVATDVGSLGYEDNRRIPFVQCSYLQRGDGPVGDMDAQRDVVDGGVDCLGIGRGKGVGAGAQPVDHPGLGHRGRGGLLLEVGDVLFVGLGCLISGREQQKQRNDHPDEDNDGNHPAQPSAVVLGTVGGRGFRVTDNPYFVVSDIVFEVCHLLFPFRFNEFFQLFERLARGRHRIFVRAVVRQD